MREPQPRQRKSDHSLFVCPDCNAMLKRERDGGLSACECPVVRVESAYVVTVAHPFAWFRWHLTERDREWFTQIGVAHD
jgi:hypothetical protein